MAATDSKRQLNLQVYLASSAVELRWRRCQPEERTKLPCASFGFAARNEAAQVADQIVDAPARIARNDK
jgi:hypothetical protein